MKAPKMSLAAASSQDKETLLGVAAWNLSMPLYSISCPGVTSKDGSYAYSHNTYAQAGVHTHTSVCLSVSFFSLCLPLSLPLFLFLFLFYPLH